MASSAIPSAAITERMPPSAQVKKPHSFLNGAFCLAKNLPKTSWEWQISPQVVQIPVGSSLGRVITLAAEEVHIPARVGQPHARAAAGTDRVVRIVQLERVKRRGNIGAGLVYVRGTLPPDPLAAGHVIFPDIVEESGRHRSAGAVTEATEEEQVTIGVDPTRRSPTRARNIGGRSVGGHVGGCLTSVSSVLIRGVASGNPGPHAGSLVKLPQVVEHRADLAGAEVGALGIQTKPAKQPDGSGGVHPQDRGLPAAGKIVGGSRPFRAVNTVHVGGNVGWQDQSPGLGGNVVFPEVIQKSDSAGRVVTLPAKDPNIAGSIGIAGCSPASARLRAGGCLISDARAALPDPLAVRKYPGASCRVIAAGAGVQIELPYVIQKRVGSYAVEALTAEHPQVAGRVRPRRASPASTRHCATARGAREPDAQSSVIGGAILKLEGRWIRGILQRSGTAVHLDRQVCRNPTTRSPPAVVFAGAGRGWPNPHIVQEAWDSIRALVSYFKSLTAEEPAVSIFIGPGHRKVPAARCIGIGSRKRRRGNRLTGSVGRQTGRAILVDGGSPRRKHPSPVVMLAIHQDVGNITDDHGRGEENVATLRLAGGRKKYFHAVGGAESELRRKRERRVARDKKVVASIVLHFKGVTRADDEAGHRAADRELGLRAGNLDVGNGAANRAAAVGEAAGLRRTCGLGQNCNRVSGARQEWNRKCKADVAGAADGEIVGAVILEREPGAEETGNGSADAEYRSAGDLNRGDVSGGGARAVGDAASLRGIRRLSLDGHGVAGNQGLKGERHRAGAGDSEVVTAVVLQNQAAASEAEDRSAYAEGGST